MKKAMISIITIFSMVLTPIYGYGYSASTTSEFLVEKQWKQWTVESNLPVILRQSLQNIVAVLLSTSPGSYCVFPVMGRSDLMSDLIETADVDNYQANEIMSDLTSKYPLCGETRGQEIIQSIKQELENLVVNAKAQSIQFLEPYPLLELFENNTHKKTTPMNTKKKTASFNWLNSTFPFILNLEEIFVTKDHSNKDSMPVFSVNGTNGVVSGNRILLDEYDEYNYTWSDVGEVMLMWVGVVGGGVSGCVAGVGLASWMEFFREKTWLTGVVVGLGWTAGAVVVITMVSGPYTLMVLSPLLGFAQGVFASVCADGKEHLLKLF